MFTARSAQPDAAIEHSGSDVRAERDPAGDMMHCKGGRKRCSDLALDSPKKFLRIVLCRPGTLVPRSIRAVAQSDIRCHTAPTTCTAAVSHYSATRNPAASLCREDYCCYSERSKTGAMVLNCITYARPHASRSISSSIATERQAI